LWRLNCIKITEEIKEHDPHSAACFVQKQIDDGIFIINPRMMSKLGPERFHSLIEASQNSRTFMMWEVRVAGLQSPRVDG